MNIGEPAGEAFETARRRALAHYLEELAPDIGEEGPALRIVDLDEPRGVVTLALADRLSCSTAAVSLVSGLRWLLAERFDWIHEVQLLGLGIVEN